MNLVVRCRTISLHVTERGSTASNMDCHKMIVFLVIYLINKSDAQFTSGPGSVEGCLNKNVTLLWNIADYDTVQFVTWKKGASPIMSQSGQNAPTSFLPNIKHGGNGAVVIVGVQSVDGGEYSCDIFSAFNVGYSSTATLSILVAPINLPPRLESVVENNSINHTCVLETKGTPEVDVTIKIGSDEKSSATHSVLCEREEDISCCVSGDAVTCLTESSVAKQCWNLKVPPSYPPHLNSIKESDSMKHACVVDKKDTPEVAVTIKAPDESFEETVMNAGPIIGGVVGSVMVFVIGIVVAVLMFKRRNGKLRSKERSTNPNNQTSLSPTYWRYENVR